MSSSRAESSADPKKPLDVNRPFWKLATDVPEYHEWVQQGGLALFAERHGLDIDFINKMIDVPAEKMLKFRDELAKLPTVEEHIITVSRAYDDAMGYMSWESAREVMRQVEGWSDNEDEDDEEEEETSAETPTNAETASQKTQSRDTHTKT